MQDNNKEIYSHNEVKSVVAKIISRTLKNKVYEHMTAILKNFYIDKLDNMVNRCNNAYHSTIKIKPHDVKSGTYISIKKIMTKILNSKLVIMWETLFDVILE